MTSTRAFDPAVEAPVILDERMEFRVSEDFKERMEEMARASGMRVADLFRRAIGLYDIAYEQEKKGLYMAFVSYDENEQPRIEKVFSL